MLMSMTGFGRSTCDVPIGKIAVEISSVNRKHLEILISLPPEFSLLESEVRGWVGEALSRGHVTLRAYFAPNEQSQEGIAHEIEWFRERKAKWRQIAEEIGCDPNQVDLLFLARHFPFSGRKVLVEKEAFRSFRCCVEEALRALLDMKRREGKALVRDLAKRLKTAKKLTDTLGGVAPPVAERMYEKWTRQIKELAPFGADIEEKVFQELALLVGKGDISEEISRLYSHFEQFSALLRSEGVGKKMDFLLQEMGREINTIGAKSADAKISHLVVELKSEFEKMREQVQNIE